MYDYCQDVRRNPKNTIGNYSGNSHWPEASLWHRAAPKTLSARRLT